MKKVEFIEIKSVIRGWGGFKGSKYIFPNITEIIEEKIKDGWEYCGYVPLTTRGTGDIEKLALVFEKEE